MLIPAGIAKFVAAVAITGSLGMAGYKAVQPPPVAPQMRQTQAVQQWSERQKQRDVRRKEQLRRDAAAADRRRAVAEARRRAKAERLLRAGKELAKLLKPKLRLR